MPTVYKTSDDTELQAVSKLTAILADLRSGPGDTVAERALIYAAARAGIQLHVYKIEPRPAAPPAPAPEPLPIEDRPVRYDCPHCGREFVTKASRDGHMSHCPARAPVATPEPVVMVGEPPHPGTLDYLWRKAWPRPCPECWRAGTRWEAAGPRAMADHRFHHHAIPMDAGHRLAQSLAVAPAVQSTDARGWSCAACRSAAFARYRDSDVCVRCMLKSTDVAVS